MTDPVPLCVRVFDVAKHSSVARRVADNLEVSIRRIRRCTQPGTLHIEISFCPEARVASQGIIAAFGLLLGCVAKAARETSHDETSPTFIPGVCHALRATFARLRKDAGERGKDDVGMLLVDSA